MGQYEKDFYSVNLSWPNHNPNPLQWEFAWQLIATNHADVVGVLGTCILYFVRYAEYVCHLLQQSEASCVCLYGNRPGTLRSRSGHGCFSVHSSSRNEQVVARNFHWHVDPKPILRLKFVVVSNLHYFTLCCCRHRRCCCRGCCWWINMCSFVSCFFAAGSITGDVSFPVLWHSGKRSGGKIGENGDW